MSVNKVILVGNVGKDPEVRYLDENTAMAKFPMATSETYKNRSGERVSNTEWHNVVLWRGLATVAERFVKKGTQIYIEGRIKTRSYDDQDGNRKYITEIVGDQMQLLSKKPDDGADGGYGAGAPTAAPAQQAAPNQQAAPAQQAAPQQAAPSQQAAPATPQQNTPPASPAAPSQEDKQQDDPFGGKENGADDLPF